MREQSAMHEAQQDKLLLRVLDELNSHESGVRCDVDGGAYYVTGSRRWLKIVSEEGLISPMQLLALLLCGYEGLHNWRVNSERKIINEWAIFIRDSLNDGLIVARDEITGFPIGKIICPDDMEILDCMWCMTVSDANKLIHSKNIEFDFTAMAKRLYNKFFEDAFNQRGCAEAVIVAPVMSAALGGDTTPGKMPNTGIGKLAVKVAYQIEKDCGKPATANQVMNKLYELIDKEPILKEKIPYGIKWITTNHTEACFYIEACGKVLTKWNLTRV